MQEVGRLREEKQRLEDLSVMAENNILIPVGQIAESILIIRGERVILDANLAAFYGVTTKAFNQAIKRNRERFPEDFMFQLTSDERNEVVTNCDRLGKLKFSPHLPQAFTEHGAIMAAGILNSPRAVEVSVFVVRAFIKLRQAVSEHRELAHKIAELERKLTGHDQQILSIIQAIKHLAGPASPQKRNKIGFAPPKSE